MFEQHERFKADGLDFWTGFHHVPATNSISFLSSLIFAQSNIYAWHDIISAPPEEAKLALLADADWRGRRGNPGAKTWPHSPPAPPPEVTRSGLAPRFGPPARPPAPCERDSGAAST